MSNETITIEVTINGDTRPVEFYLLREGKLAMSARQEFAARVGRGTKAHRVGMDAWQQADGTYKVSMRTVALNKQASIVGWADEMAGKSYASKHTGSAI